MTKAVVVYPCDRCERVFPSPTDINVIGKKWLCEDCTDAVGRATKKYPSPDLYTLTCSAPAAEVAPTPRKVTMETP